MSAEVGFIQTGTTLYQTENRRHTTRTEAKRLSGRAPDLSCVKMRPSKRPLFLCTQAKMPRQQSLSTPNVRHMQQTAACTGQNCVQELSPRRETSAITCTEGRRAFAGLFTPTGVIGTEIMMHKAPLRLGTTLCSGYYMQKHSRCQAMALTIIAPTSNKTHSNSPSPCKTRK